MFTNRLSKLISCIENQKVSMVCSNAYFLIGDKKTTQLVRDSSQWSKSQHINKYDFLIQNPVIGSSAIFRRKAFEQIDKKIFQYKNFIEWIHWFQYTLLDGVYFISDPYLYYRKHPNNITNTIIGTKDYNEYKRFCRRYVLNNLKFVEIIREFISIIVFYCCSINLWITNYPNSF